MIAVGSYGRAGWSAVALAEADRTATAIARTAAHESRRRIVASRVHQSYARYPRRRQRRRMLRSAGGWQKARRCSRPAQPKWRQHEATTTAEDGNTGGGFGGGAPSRRITDATARSAKHHDHAAARFRAGRAADHVLHGSRHRRDRSRSSAAWCRPTRRSSDCGPVRCGPKDRRGRGRDAISCGATFRTIVSCAGLKTMSG